MPLQNRITPAGDIIAVAARGLFMGNRGCLHDDHGRIRRHFQTRRWIACLLEFKNRRLELLKPGHYTPLFFLDEVTALAAGHRPCAECRRQDFRRFMALWPHESSRSSASRVDELLHGERTGSRAMVPLASLPDGVFLRLPGDSRPFLFWDNSLLGWTPFGYETRTPAADLVVEVLTPPSTVEVLRNGYVPVVHPSAGIDLATAGHLPLGAGVSSPEILTTKPSALQAGTA